MTKREQYLSFLESKSHSGQDAGFEPVWMPPFLYDFQAMLVKWALRKGRAAIFADCGLGKTPCQLVWAENVVRKTNKSVLIATPLAVSAQTVREAEKFGIEAKASRLGKINAKITVTNYERLHYFNPNDYIAVVCDESSVLKAFDGKRRKEITRFLSKLPYRLLCTATAAPNDYVEIGTSSEALGIMNQSDMIDQFFYSSDKQRHSLFRQGDFWSRPRWFLKPHADMSFWRWVCSWARALQRPSDLGFDDGPFKLPEISIRQILVKNRKLLPGMLFPLLAETLREQR